MALFCPKYFGVGNIFFNWNKQTIYSPFLETTKPRVFPIFKGTNLLASNVKDYRENLQITYHSTLQFSSKKSYYQLKKRTEKALKKEAIPTKQKWLGCLYDLEIRDQILPDLSMHWIHEDIGFGVFTENSIKKHTFIGEYVGLVRKRRKKLDEKNAYVFENLIGDSIDTHYTIDAKKSGNHIRFMIHKEFGICDALLVLHKGFMKVILLANQDIPAGSQLTYDYGIDYWNKRHDLKTL